MSYELIYQLGGRGQRIVFVTFGGELLSTRRYGAGSANFSSMNEFEEQATRMLDAMDVTVSAPTAVPMPSPQQELVDEVLSFFKKRTRSIDKNEKIKQLVLDKLEEKIETDEISDPEKLMAVFRMVASDSREGSESIFGLFRPSPQGSMLENLIRPKEATGELEDAFREMSPNQLQQLEEISRNIRKVMETSEGDAPLEILDDGTPQY
jgi:hypothetical protein